MPTVALLNQEGQKVRDLELNEEIFGAELNNQVVYDVVNAQRAAMRHGTHDTKTRNEVRGGGRKPWRQKGTGRARQGSINAPQWRHGGIVFGPTPRSYAVKVNRKVARLAMRCALSEKVSQNKLIAVEAIELNEIKTKNFVQVLNNLGANGKTLVVLPEISEFVGRSAANVSGACVNVSNHVSVYDVLNADKVVLALGSIEYFEEVLK